MFKIIAFIFCYLVILPLGRGQTEHPAIKSVTVNTTYYRVWNGDTLTNEVEELKAKFNKEGDTLSAVRKNSLGIVSDKKAVYRSSKTKLNVIVPNRTKKVEVYDGNDSLLKYKVVYTGAGKGRSNNRMYLEKYYRNEAGYALNIKRYTKRYPLMPKRRSQFHHYEYDTLNRRIYSAMFYPRYPDFDSSVFIYWYDLEDRLVKLSNSSSEYFNHFEYTAHDLLARSFATHKITGDTASIIIHEYTFTDSTYGKENSTATKYEVKYLTGEYARMDCYPPFKKSFIYKYNDNMQLTEFYIATPDSTYLHEEIKYNANGDIQSTIGFDGISNYFYKNGLLVKVTSSKKDVFKKTREYTYDSYGNLIRNSDLAIYLTGSGQYHKRVRNYSYTFYR